MIATLQVDTPEYVTMGGEDTAVYIYDISGQHHKGAKVVNKLQVRPSSWSNVRPVAVGKSGVHWTRLSKDVCSS